MTFCGPVVGVLSSQPWNPTFNPWEKQRLMDKQNEERKKKVKLRHYKKMPRWKVNKENKQSHAGHKTKENEQIKQTGKKKNQDKKSHK